MTQREKNNLGLIVLLLVFAAAFFLLNPMFRFSFSRIFMHDWLGIADGDFAIGLPFRNGIGVARLLPLGLMYMLWAGVSLWVYRDAEHRNLNGLLWGLFVFIGNIIGLIIYLILRSTSPEPATPGPMATSKSCPDCGQPVQASYIACPHCAATLAVSCRECGKRLESDWTACPYCGVKVHD